MSMGEDSPTRCESCKDEAESSLAQFRFHEHLLSILVKMRNALQLASKSGYCIPHDWWSVFADYINSRATINQREISVLPLLVVLGGFSLLLPLLFTAVSEIFTHSKRYSASHQRLMLLKKHHPEKMAWRHAKNMSKWGKNREGKHKSIILAITKI